MLTQLELLKEAYLQEGTPTYSNRLRLLKRIEVWIQKNEPQFYDALYKDLAKSQFESYETELMPIYQELKYLQKNLKKLMQNDKVKTPVHLLPARSYIEKLPYGQVLIIAPWNYPIQLSLIPLISALAAGNTVVLKPSEHSKHASNLLLRMFQDLDLDPYVTVILGDAKVSQEILKHPFDKIFFTGSPQVGKEILKAAAPHLTPVVLELGGKSPAIIDTNTNLKHAVKRLIWGKYINAGQTCIAPDYVLVHTSQVDEFLNEAVLAIETSVTSVMSDYPKIINCNHLARLQGLIDDTLVYGGELYEHKLLPTLLLNPDLDSAVMQEEIFGPILPILTYDTEEDLLNITKHHPNPLALYIFSNDQDFIDRMTCAIPSGGLCINDTLVHFANSYLPFGGIGSSGMGSYHYKKGFDTFTHHRSVINRSPKLEMNLRYPPYKGKLKLLKKLTK